MTQTPGDPFMPRGERPRLEPPQQVLLAPGGPKKVKRWPAAVGAGFLGLFIGVGLGANSPRAADTTSAGAASTVTVSASTVTVMQPAPAAPQVDDAIPAAEAPAQSGSGGPLTTFSDGTYEVGTGDGQVAPGKYKSSGGGMCYWARLKHNDGAIGDIVDNNVGQGQMILNVAKSDGYVEIRGCTFTKS
jgi:hypothetical protein